MALTQTEFEALLTDATKRIEGDIVWQNDEDHSPSGGHHGARYGAG